MALFEYLDSIQEKIEEIDILTYGWLLSRRDVYYIEIMYAPGIRLEEIKEIEKKIKEYISIQNITWPIPDPNIIRKYRISPVPQKRSKHYIHFTKFPLKIENQIKE